MKSLESAAFIGGFISAHYVKLYIKPSWKPPGSPTVKRRFQMRKTRASNGSSFCLHLHRFLPLSPCLPPLPQDLSSFFRLGHSVLFLTETDQQYIWKWILHSAVTVQETLFPHHKIYVGEKYKKSGCKNYLAAMWIFLFLFSNNFKSIKPLESVFSGHMAGAADKSCSDKHPLCW